MSDQPKRPWWRKKRWRLFVAFWLLLPLYPASTGLTAYLDQRCWLPRGVHDLWSKPARDLAAAAGMQRAFGRFQLRSRSQALHDWGVVIRSRHPPFWSDPTPAP